jgi:hypothetical protein
MFSYNSHPKPIGLFFFLLLLPCLSSFSQTLNDLDWHQSIDHDLKGNVKSWTMKRGAKVIRQQQYGRGGALVKDSRLRQRVFSVNPLEIMDTVKTYEKTYPLKDTQVTETTEGSVTYTQYNKHGQLLKRMMYELIYTEGKSIPGKRLTSGLKNQFNTKGQIIVSRYYAVQTHMRYWNSVGHNPPYYFYTDSIGYISVFRYNEHGDITSFEHYNKDPFKNAKADYRYDSNRHLIAKDMFDRTNVMIKYFHDDNVTKKIADDIWRMGDKFDVNTNWPKYWYSDLSGVRISTERWTYNSRGQKIEYTTSSDYRAVWNYNEDGTAWERHYISSYEIPKEWLYKTMLLDKQGNVVTMSIYDRWEKKNYDFTFDITYY